MIIQIIKSKYSRISIQLQLTINCCNSYDYILLRTLVHSHLKIIKNVINKNCLKLLKDTMSKYTLLCFYLIGGFFSIYEQVKQLHSNTVSVVYMGVVLRQSQVTVKLSYHWKRRKVQEDQAIRKSLSQMERLHSADMGSGRRMYRSQLLLLDFVFFFCFISLASGSPM